MREQWNRLSLALFALLGALIALTFRDYGLSWDEPFHIEYGARLLKYYASLGADASAFHYINLHLYGGLFDTPVAALVQVLPFGLIDNRHLLIALVGLLGVVGAWRLTHFIAGPRAAFFAALLLVLMPGWYGHMFINPKDIPFATTMIWASYFLARMAVDFGRPRWHDVLLFGLCAGMAMGMRIGGVLIWGYLASVFAAWLIAQGLRRRQVMPLLRTGGRLALRLLPAALLAYGVMLLVWPWALAAPLSRPLEALTTFSRFPFDTLVEVEGVWLHSTELPADYLPLMMAVKIPLLQLVLLAGLVTLLLVGVRRLWGLLQRNDNRWLAWLTPLVAVLLPLGYVLVEQPVLYNEMRHFLFVLPPLAVLCGISAELAWRALRPRPAFVRAAVVMTLAVYLLFHTLQMARLHPYEYVYYNRLVGGVSGASRLFELDYWSTSLREVYAQLKQRLVQTEGPQALQRPYRIRVCGAPEASLHYFEPGWVPLWVGVPGQEDFVIGTVGHMCPTPQDRLMAEVRRDGILLGYAQDRRREHPAVSQ